MKIMLRQGYAKKAHLFIKPYCNSPI